MNLELLSPAGNADIGIAAIEHGADAVYIGAPQFSARANAACSISDIARLIQYAHRYYAKVYTALNTILRDDELTTALESINRLYDTGCDGLIIQDVGLLELPLPPIPLIASTQMHNDTAQKVQFLEAVGFKRAILARELSLSDITEIRKQTSMELEVFVHGALCVSYSGQCYLSQAIANRSGNRGTCAQPCRSCYDLLDGNGDCIVRNKFLLCLKDMNRSQSIPQLIAAGVRSFKIEGRYKEMDYVKNVTAYYSMLLNDFIKANPEYRRSSSGKCEYYFQPDLCRTFNRGYTEYFLYNSDDKPASIDTQKSIGRPLGKVTQVKESYFRADCEQPGNGDGLCYFNEQNELCGFKVNNVHNGKIYPNNMPTLAVGTLLYRNYDAAFERLLKKTSASRKIEISLYYVQIKDSISLAAVDEDGNRAEIQLPVAYQPAKDAAMVAGQINKQLARTGQTPYRVKELEISPEKPGFVPISTLNDLRRQCIDELGRCRIENYRREKLEFIPNDVQYPTRTLDFRANVLNDKARQFYARHEAKVSEPAFESLSSIKDRPVMISRYCIRRQLNACLRTDTAAALKEPLRIRDQRYSYLLAFDCRNCRMSVIFEGEYK